MTTETDTTEPEPEVTDTDTTDWKAEAEKHKALARKHEERAKANSAAAKELEAFKQQSMSDTDRAVAQAKAEARTEALREVGSKLAESAVRVAAAGRNVDVDALLEGVDAARFLDDNGDPDTKAIAAWMDRVAPAEPSRRDFGQGVRGGQTPAVSSDPLVRTLTELTQR